MRTDFTMVKHLVALAGVFSATVFGAVVVLAATGREVTSFMWGRSAAVLASVLVTYWLVVVASRGKRWAYERVRFVSVVVPIAIVAVDVVAGGLPGWFMGLQIACAVALAVAAVPVHRLRAAFPKSR